MSDTQKDTQELDEILELLHNSWFEDDYDPTDPDAMEAKKELLALIASREQTAELRGRVSELINMQPAINKGMAETHRLNRLEALQATKPLDNSERNAHYNVYKLGKEYREATKPEKGASQ